MKKVDKKKKSERGLVVIEDAKKNVSKDVFKHSKLAKSIAEANTRQLRKFAESIKQLTQLSDILPKIQIPTFEPPEYDVSGFAEQHRRKIEKEVEEAEIRRLQLQILKKQLDDIKPRPPKYNVKTSVLSFAGKNIQIPLNSKAEMLCQIVLKDKKAMLRQWSWDEIVEEWGNSPDEEQRHVVYRAAKRVNTKVARKTGIEDLLLVTTKTTQVNPLYLSPKKLT